MDYRIELPPDLDINPADFAAAWNEDSECQRIAVARMEGVEGAPQCNMEAAPFSSRHGQKRESRKFICFPPGLRLSGFDFVSTVSNSLRSGWIGGPPKPACFPWNQAP